MQPGALHLVAADQPTPLADLASCPTGEVEVAINGGFYDEDGKAMGLVRVAKKTVTPISHSGSGIAVSRAGTVKIVHRDHVGSLDDVDWAVQSIDRILTNGKNLVGDPEGPLDARSAIGIRADGQVVLLTIFDEEAVDERTDKEIRLGKKSTSTGVSLWTLAETLRNDYDVVDALNLDGGYSTSFYTPDHYVVGYRPTINALVACSTSSLGRTGGDR